jgi:hypothetical protein
MTARAACSAFCAFGSGACSDSMWAALYQQRPAPEEGDYFKAAWLKPCEASPDRKTMRVYGGSDYAVTADGGDYTVHLVVGLDPEGGCICSISGVDRRHRTNGSKRSVTWSSIGSPWAGRRNKVRSKPVLVRSWTDGSESGRPPAIGRHFRRGEIRLSGRSPSEVAWPWRASTFRRMRVGSQPCAPSCSASPQANMTIKWMP